MPCGATQNGGVMMEKSDRMWSTGEGSGNPPQYPCLENPMDSMKRQKYRTLKHYPGWKVPNMLLENSEVTPERVKRRSESKNSTQLWMWLVMEVKPDAVKNNIA